MTLQNVGLGRTCFRAIMSEEQLVTEAIPLELCFIVQDGFCALEDLGERRTSMMLQKLGLLALFLLMSPTLFRGVFFVKGRFQNLRLSLGVFFVLQAELGGNFGPEESTLPTPPPS